MYSYQEIHVVKYDKYQIAETTLHYLIQISKKYDVFTEALNRESWHLLRLLDHHAYP